jgi:hypothetical protein
MPYPSRQLVIPLTPAEERALIGWAKRHERSPVAQVRWLLREVLQGTNAPVGDLTPARASVGQAIVAA